MPLTNKFDKEFCMMAKKYGLSKLLLKSMAMIESSLNPKAYRYEPGFWKRYLKDNPEWNKKDPAKVSASWGLMQLMYTTAWGLGWRGEAEDLEIPVINIELGAKLMAKLIKQFTPQKHYWLRPVDFALARYNGGSYKNPDENQVLRQQKYVDKVMAVYAKLKETEEECDD